MAILGTSTDMSQQQNAPNEVNTESILGLKPMLYILFFWGIVAIVNFTQRQVIIDEKYSEGAFSALVLLCVNISLSILILRLLHLFNTINKPLKVLWMYITVIVIVFGYIAAVLNVFAMGFYFKYLNDMRYFIFFWRDVYANWTVMSILFFAWIGLYLSAYNYKKMVTIEQENADLLIQHKESQLNLLIGQLNPHFLFNGLNNIRSLMLEDVGRARDMLTRLSELLRYSLLSNEVPFRTLHEELEIIQNYIELAKIQYEDRLHYIEQVDPDLHQTKVPSLLVQLMIENAVRHGIDRCKDGGDLVLTIQKSTENNATEQVMITVTNPGQINLGSSKNKIGSTSTGIGIENIRKRLQLLFADQASFELSQEPEKVVAKCSIPLQR
jgi:two-component system, LytTR family, sensor kinase